MKIKHTGRKPPKYLKYNSPKINKFFFGFLKKKTKIKKRLSKED